MKKRLGFLVMLVCVLAFGLVFVGCKDGGGGGLSIKSIALDAINFDTNSYYGIDGEIPPSPTDYDEAEEAFGPIYFILAAKVEYLSGLIEAYMTTHQAYIQAQLMNGKNPFTETLKIEEIITAPTNTGLKNVTGTLRIVSSLNTKTLEYSGGMTTTMSFEYDSAFDASSTYIYKLYVKSNVNSVTTVTGNSITGSNTEVENATTSYVLAYAGIDYCGLVALNFKYKTTETENPDDFNINSASGNLIFYGLDNKQSFKHTLTPAEAETMVPTAP